MKDPHEIRTKRSVSAKQTYKLSLKKISWIWEKLQCSKTKGLPTYSVEDWVKEKIIYKQLLKVYPHQRVGRNSDGGGGRGRIQRCDVRLLEGGCNGTYTYTQGEGLHRRLDSTLCILLYTGPLIASALTINS